MGKYLDMVNEWETHKQQAGGEAQPLPIQSPSATSVLLPAREVKPAPWPCQACSGQVQLEPAGDDAPTRFWACGCGAWGATQEGAAYSVVWVGRRTVH
jgi:hypothetical protein